MGAKMEQMELFGDLDARDLVPPPLSVEPEPDMGVAFTDNIDTKNIALFPRNMGEWCEAFCFLSA